LLEQLFKDYFPEYLDLNSHVSVLRYYHQLIFSYERNFVFHLVQNSTFFALKVYRVIHGDGLLEVSRKRFNIFCWNFECSL